MFQNYSNFEVIYVDDHSVDDSFEYLKGFKDRFEQLSLLELERNNHGKKAALNKGVEASKFSWLALTDVDCIPSSSNWLYTMAQNATESKKIVIAYAPYSKTSGLLNLLIRFECWINGMQYLGACAKGFPYMGVGRNLFYHKSLFDSNKLQLDIPYGDDDLFIKSIAHRCNTTYTVDPNSFVYTEGETSYLHYIQQKWRHYSTSRHYSLWIKIYLLGFFISMAGSLSFVLLIGFKYGLILSMFIYFMRLLFILPVVRRKSVLLHEHDLFLLFPLMEIAYLIHLIIQIPLLWKIKKTW